MFYTSFLLFLLFHFGCGAFGGVGTLKLTILSVIISGTIH